MIATQPDVSPLGLYSQSQAAAALGIDRHTVARYEKEGYLIFKVRKVGKRKVTTGAQIIKCWKNTYI